MQQIKCFLVLVFLTGYYYSSAQKTVEGVKFSCCLNKKELAPEFYKGKFLVLDFWATWCGPCIASFPTVSALQKKYAANPKIVFASVTAQPKGLVDTFFHRKKDMMPGILHLIDDSGATWSYFDASVIPNLLVFAPSGNIVFSGRVEKLSSCMNKLLKGANLYKESQRHGEDVPDKWGQYQKSASFIAVTGPADSADKDNEGSNFSADRSRVNIKNCKSQLLSVVASVGNLTSVEVTTNDSVKATQLISLYYKQVKNNFPEFDKGIFGCEYQNHILGLLEKIYSFHCQWIKEQVSAYKVIAKNKQLLDKSLTLSTRGSSYSSAGKKVSFINQPLSVIAGMTEDCLNVPAYADSAGTGYDLDLDFSSLPLLEKSLSRYGLALEKTEGYEKKKLNIVFNGE